MIGRTSRSAQGPVDRLRRVLGGVRSERPSSPEGGPLRPCLGREGVRLAQKRETTKRSTQRLPLAPTPRDGMGPCIGSLMEPLREKRAAVHKLGAARG